MRAKGLLWYNSTTIDEMDLGDYSLQITSYMDYNAKKTLTDKGTYVFCHGLQYKYA